MGSSNALPREEVHGFVRVRVMSGYPMARIEVVAHPAPRLQLVQWRGETAAPTVRFGAAEVGGPSVYRPVVVESTGSVPLTCSATLEPGSDGAAVLQDFSVAPAEGSVRPGGRLVFVLRYTPRTPHKHVSAVLVVRGASPRDVHRIELEAVCIEQVLSVTTHATGVGGDPHRQVMDFGVVAATTTTTTTTDGHPVIVSRSLSAYNVGAHTALPVLVVPDPTSGTGELSSAAVTAKPRRRGLSAQARSGYGAWRRRSSSFAAAALRDPDASAVHVVLQPSMPWGPWRARMLACTLNGVMRRVDLLAHLGPVVEVGYSQSVLCGVTCPNGDDGDKRSAFKPDTARSGITSPRQRLTVSVVMVPLTNRSNTPSEGVTATVQGSADFRVLPLTADAPSPLSRATTGAAEQLHVNSAIVQRVGMATISMSTAPNPQAAWKRASASCSIDLAPQETRLVAVLFSSNRPGVHEAHLHVAVPGLEVGCVASLGSQQSVQLTLLARVTELYFLALAKCLHGALPRAFLFHDLHATSLEHRHLRERAPNVSSPAAECARCLEQHPSSRSMAPPLTPPRVRGCGPGSSRLYQ